MFERFTDRARRVTVLAQEEARMLAHNYIGTEHILLGLIHEGDGAAARALAALGISLEGVRSKVEGIIGQGSEAPTGHIPFTPRAKKVLELSLREALQLGHNYIGTEHILLGLIREGEGVGAQVMNAFGVELTVARQKVIEILSGYRPFQQPVKSAEGSIPQGNVEGVHVAFVGGSHVTALLIRELGKIDSDIAIAEQQAAGVEKRLTELRAARIEVCAHLDPSNAKTA